MDLRDCNLSPERVELGASVLNYQPFILSDDIQTGVAYSWLYSAESGRLSKVNDFVWRRQAATLQEWERFSDANARLRNMYEDWLDAIAQAYPGGTLLDPACNNGYFLVGALRRGMNKAIGYDRVDYSDPVRFLNESLGTSAEFIHQPYSSWTHRIEGCQRYDVAVASLIMCHISDPLYFLAFLGRVAKEAIFLFTGMSTAPGYAIHYSKPNKFYPEDDFPVCFDNDVGLSRDLLFESLNLMGFKNIRLLNYKPSWLPMEWYSNGSQQAILAMRP
jgi:hypothetical protein